MIRGPPGYQPLFSSAASDGDKRQLRGGRDGVQRAGGGHGDVRDGGVRAGVRHDDRGSVRGHVHEPANDLELWCVWSFVPDAGWRNRELRGRELRSYMPARPDPVRKHLHRPDHHEQLRRVRQRVRGGAGVLRDAPGVCAARVGVEPDGGLGDEPVGQLDDRHGV